MNPTYLHASYSYPNQYFENHNALAKKDLEPYQAGKIQSPDIHSRYKEHPYPISPIENDYTTQFANNKPSTISPEVKKSLQELHDKFEELFNSVEYNDLPSPLNKLLVHTKDMMELNLQYSAISKLGSAASKSANKLLNTNL